MRNIKLTIAYDGTEFHGWQSQHGQATIQGALTGVLRKLTQEHVTLHAAGRTDAGVHARSSGEF
jgi:tRNA pseudouridine38-40 synthase